MHLYLSIPDSRLGLSKEFLNKKGPSAESQESVNAVAFDDAQNDAVSDAFSMWCSGQSVGPAVVEVQARVRLPAAVLADFMKSRAGHTEGVEI